MSEELLTRLNSGRTTKPLEGQGSKFAPRLTDEEVKVAAGMIKSSFDHGLLLALHGAGLHGYHRSEKTGRPQERYGIRFDSLLQGAREIAWQIRNHRKRKGIDRFASNIIAGFALEACFEGSPRSDVHLARVCGIHRTTWLNNYAQHYQDVISELQIRAGNALEDMRENLG